MGFLYLRYFYHGSAHLYRRRPQRSAYPFGMDGGSGTYFVQVFDPQVKHRCNRRVLREGDVDEPGKFITKNLAIKKEFHIQASFVFPRAVYLQLLMKETVLHKKTRESGTINVYDGLPISHSF